MKLGIYGGTFSPPHYGHLHAALSFFKEIQPDRLLIMPANIPPHKAESAISAEDRLEMTRLAFAELPEFGERIFVDDFEIQKPGKSYTAETLTHFSAPDRELYFLCGTDMFLTLGSWYRPDVICSLSTIVLMRRENDRELDGAVGQADADLKRRFGARTLQITVPPIEISSSEIRGMIAGGQDVSGYLPDGVLRYMKEKKLYGYE